jgi:hypothetical protein
MKRRLPLAALSIVFLAFVMPPSTAAQAAPVLSASAICAPDDSAPSKGCVYSGMLLGPSTLTSELALDCRTERFGVCRKWLITVDRIGGLGFTRQHPKERQSLVGYCALPDSRYFTVNPAVVELDSDCDEIPDRSDSSLRADSSGYVYGSYTGSGFGSKMYNVTVVDAKGPGYIAVFPCGGGIPPSSAQNFDTGQTIASFVLLADYDATCVYSSERVDYIVDSLGDSFVTPVSLTRALDTRDGTGTTKQQLAAGQTLTMNINGKAGLPATLDAVAISVTAVGPASAGFVTVYPCDQAQPQASNLNFAADQTIANAVFVSPSASGDLCLFSSATVDLLVDLSGYIAPHGSRWSPERVLDTRSAKGPKAAGTTIVKVAGTTRIPSDADSVIANLTAVNAAADGFVTAYRCGEAVPVISNLNFRAGQTIANLATVKPDANGNICLFSNVAVDLLLDVSGSFELVVGGYPSSAPIRLFDSRKSSNPQFPLYADDTVTLGR